MSAATAARPAAVTVGTRSSSGPCRVAELFADAGVTLPPGSVLASGIAAELLSPAIGSAHRTGFTWTSSEVLAATATVRAHTVVTRIAEGRAERYLSLADDTGRTLGTGVDTWVAEHPESLVAAPELDFGSIAWGNLLSDRLEDDATFTSALATWDGTIGLRCGDREVHLRIYRGTVVDVTRRTPHGATFTFVAPPHTWVDLMLSESNDFVRRAIRGEFSSTGDGYEYLRLTRPLDTIIGHARALARKADS